MGGRLDQEAQRGEHNFSSDAEATRLVLECSATRYVGTWEITRLATLGEGDLPRLRAGTPACRAAADQLELYLRQFRKRSETPMFDPITLTLAYTGSFLTTRPMTLSWHLPGDDMLGAVRDTVGLGAPRAYLAASEVGPSNAHVSVDLDTAAFKEHLLTTIGA
jgi:inosine-uridine nucleoside N-ribohydrolase